MSSSVHELRGRIGAVDEAIEQQKEILRDLVRQRSSIQTELNSLLDPMARLPPELSSDILLQSMPATRTWQSLIKLLCVCRAWHDLALATPSLWGTITDKDIPEGKFAKVLKMCLARAGGLPISLILREGENTFHRILQTLGAHIPRIQHMELSPLHNDSLERMTYPFDGLNSLNISRSDIISKLFVELLRRAPNLVRLDIYDVRFNTASTPRHLTHLTLQRLHFGRPGDWYNSEISILRFLTLPALQSLVISRREITEADLLDFLTRSAPPLRHLNLRLRAEDPHSQGIAACLQLIPGLTHLEITMFADSTHSSFDLWAMDPNVLPALQSLTISEFYQHVSEGYARVLDFLAKRHSSLRSLRLVVTGTQVLDDTVAAALRVFRDEGMSFYVGTRETTFL